MSRLKKKLDESNLDITDLFDDDSIEDRVLSKEDERKKKIQNRITVLAMLLAVVVIIGTVVISQQDDSEKKADNKGGNKGTTVQNAVETTSEPTSNLLVEDEYPEITELIQLYYDAKLKGDTAQIEKYVDNIEEVNMEEIEVRNESVESYENIECYTKLGLYDNTYVVFVYYEIAFKNIDTLAPGIDVIYVIRDEETGSVYIHNGATANNDINNYVQALAKDEDVAELLDRTNKALEQALKEDSALNDFYKALNKGTDNAKDK